MSTQTIIPTETVSTEAPRFESDGRACFRKNKLLAGISEEIYAQVAHEIDVIHCGPNEIIFQEDEPGDSLYLIARGSVKISKKGWEGQQETLAYLMERDFFGEMALVDSGKRSAQAAAVGTWFLGESIARVGIRCCDSRLTKCWAISPSQSQNDCAITINISSRRSCGTIGFRSSARPSVRSCRT